MSAHGQVSASSDAYNHLPRPYIPNFSQLSEREYGSVAVGLVTDVGSLDTALESPRKALAKSSQSLVSLLFYAWWRLIKFRYRNFSNDLFGLFLISLLNLNIAAASGVSMPYHLKFTLMGLGTAATTFFGYFGPTLRHKFKIYLAALIALFVSSKFAHLVRPALTQLHIRTGRLLGNIPSFSDVRSAFSGIVFPVFESKNNHSHPQSASVRGMASNILEQFIERTGQRPYYLQSSLTDRIKHRAGSRSYYWAKDLVAPYKSFGPDANDSMVLIDVDYYLDMPRLLHENPTNYYLYTLTPQATAHCSGEYSFKFRPDNTVCYQVSGGSTYIHGLWDYSSDMISVTYQGWFSSTITTYNVERVKADEHHSLIALVLSSRCVFPLWTPILETSPLLRLQVSVGKYAILTQQTKDGNVTHVSPIDSYAHCSINTAELDLFRTKAAASSKPLVPGSLTYEINSLTKEQALILTNLVNDQVHGTAKASTAIVPVVQYEAYNKYSSLDDAKPAVRPYMKPLVSGAYAPLRSKANDEQMVEGRVRAIKNATTYISPQDMNYMKEFVALVAPDEHAGHPCNYDEILERQKRPGQRAIIESVAQNYPVDFKAALVESFMKAESYEKPSDPRAISTIEANQKIAYSMLTYPIMDAVSKHDFYAFGKNPVDIAQRVVNVCAKATHVINTDLSRFDGRMSYALRCLEEYLMKRFYAPEYHKDMLKLMRLQHNQNAKTKFGIRYETGYSRLSGSPETAIFNTIVNAFMAYYALRTSDLDCASNPVACFEKLGIYGGDDGITPDLSSAHYISVASHFGHVLEAEPIKRGDFGVTFLARYYSPLVWFGEPDSICDIPRTLRKLHLTHSSDISVTPELKLYQKCSGLVHTDRNTPVVGAFATIALQLYLEEGRETPEIDHKVAGWWAQFQTSENFPNEIHGSWAEEYFARVMPNFRIEEFLKWIDNVDSVQEVLQCPGFDHELALPTVKFPIVSDCEYINPPRGTEPIKDETPAPPPQPSHMIAPFDQCPHFSSGPCPLYGSKCSHLKHAALCKGPVCTFAHRVPKSNDPKTAPKSTPPKVSTPVANSNAKGNPAPPAKKANPKAHPVDPKSAPKATTAKQVQPTKVDWNTNKFTPLSGTILDPIAKAEQIIKTSYSNLVEKTEGISDELKLKLLQQMNEQISALGRIGTSSNDPSPKPETKLATTTANPTPTPSITTTPSAPSTGLFGQSKFTAQNKEYPWRTQNRPSYYDADEPVSKPEEKATTPTPTPEPVTPKEPTDLAPATTHVGGGSA